MFRDQFVEYTLGARQGNQLIPFTKVSATFMDEENLAIKKFIKENTLERFGPVIRVTAKLIFEISFEAVETSPRHKCGVKLIRPQIIRWMREQQDLDEVVRLETLIGYL